MVEPSPFQPGQTLSALGALAMIFAVMIFATSCAGPAYYSQAIGGHLGLMSARQDMTEALERADLDPAMASRLRLAADLVAFADEQLALPAKGSYQRVVITGKEAVTWNVIAAPEFSVEAKTWCFPVAGCVPYRGYFDEQEAMAFARRLEATGLDVMVSPAVAYSTLGWFDDPLLDTMLRYDEARLAGIIFHELAHQRLYLRGDTAFSEGFASFVEEIGIRQWLASIGRTDQWVDWQKQQQAAIRFNQLLLQTRSELQALYTSHSPEVQMRAAKAEIIAAMQAAYQSMVEQEWGGNGYFDGWMLGELNNAHLALATSYEGSRCAFEALFIAADENLQHFYQLAERQAALKREERAHQLKTACALFASDRDV